MLVHANRHFLRACRRHGRQAAGRYLGQYAVDLVRSATAAGRCWPITPRCRPASGYALEIRRVLARSLPEAFRSIPVRHLRPFVDRWHNSLRDSRRPTWRGPSMAVLTPGSLSATYFEHVFLARALGMPLVEGGDLVARDGEVLIKTLAGLRPVAHAAAPARLRPSPIRSSCAPIPRSASPGWWRRRAPARSRSPMRWAPAWSRRRR